MKKFTRLLPTHTTRPIFKEDGEIEIAPSHIVTSKRVVVQTREARDYVAKYASYKPAWWKFWEKPKNMHVGYTYSCTYTNVDCLELTLSTGHVEVVYDR